MTINSQPIYTYTCMCIELLYCESFCLAMFNMSHIKYSIFSWNMTLNHSRESRHCCLGLDEWLRWRRQYQNKLRPYMWTLLVDTTIEYQQQILCHLEHVSLFINTNDTCLYALQKWNGCIGSIFFGTCYFIYWNIFLGKICDVQIQSEAEADRHHQIF